MFLLGQLLEAKAHGKTSSAIKALLDLTPMQANLIIDGNPDKLIDIEDIKRGNKLRVKPGDKIPVDGIITEGESNIDESMITGEPMPVDKISGNKVYAGTINNHRSFVMQAEKIGTETLLAQIIQLVNDASRSRAPIQNLADKISKYFVPVVIFIAITTFVLWYSFGPETDYGICLCKFNCSTDHSMPMCAWSCNSNVSNGRHRQRGTKWFIDKKC